MAENVDLNAEETEETTIETTNEATETNPESTSEPSVESTGGQTESSGEDFRGELSRYLEEFGAENGSKWFIQGIDFSECQSRNNDILKGQNEKLQKQLKAAQSCESEPLSDGAAPTKRSGFAGFIRKRRGE